LKVDIFGMSSEDWISLLQNLKDGKIEMADMLALASSMSTHGRKSIKFVPIWMNAICSNMKQV
ncbi:MAG TPA: hypothetical protein PKM34_02455, partial [Bacteroidales bacterium]|nr:hypothetical protein [Bacteroidales bacterium]